MNRLKEKMEKEAKTALMEKFKYHSVMQIPKLVKVVINMGLGEAITNPKALDAAIADIASITGQKAVITKAKTSVSAFKIRTGMSIGCKVTLRGEKMYAFLDKLFNIVLPRIRDFRGISPKAFDGHGNYALGLKEQIIFPEIEYDKVDKIRGMDIIIVTTARTDEEGSMLLKTLGCPLREN